MVNFTKQWQLDRLTEFARTGRPSILSLCEQRHLQDRVECLWAVVTALKNRDQKESQANIQLIR
jgi:hypothetical protein